MKSPFNAFLKESVTADDLITLAEAKERTGRSYQQLAIPVNNGAVRCAVIVRPGTRRIALSKHHHPDITGLYFLLPKDGYIALVGNTLYALELFCPELGVIEVEEASPDTESPLRYYRVTKGDLYIVESDLTDPLSKPADQELEPVASAVAPISADSTDSPAETIPPRTKGTLYALLAAVFVAYNGSIPSLEELQRDLEGRDCKEFDPEFLKDTLKKVAEKINKIK